LRENRDDRSKCFCLVVVMVVVVVEDEWGHEREGWKINKV